MLWKVVCVVFIAIFWVSVSVAELSSPLEQGGPLLTFGAEFSLRQGGDTVAEATDIEIPFFGSGTTVGFADDYDSSCPHIAPAPDVYYRLTPENDIQVEIDLWGSQYDTRLFVFDDQLNEIACNDDYYPIVFTSYIGGLSLEGGRTYFIMVDGRYEEGEYEIRVEEFDSCEVSCVGELEGEPPLGFNYLDQFNGGCNSPQYSNPIQELRGDEEGVMAFCGISGWYQYFYEYRRDSDWLEISFGSEGEIEITSTQQERGFLYQYIPDSCPDGDLVELWPLPPCHSWTVTLTGEPGSTTWLVFMPFELSPPSSEEVYEFDYELVIRGLQQGTVQTERVPLGGIKSYYR